VKKVQDMVEEVNRGTVRAVLKTRRAPRKKRGEGKGQRATRTQGKSRVRGGE